jgi:hypothetical protein
LVSEKHIRTQNLATAVWIAERKEARVQVPKGKIFQSLGYFEASQQYLDPLEILFLVDRGILELRVQGKIASVQLAYELAITTGVDWNRYSCCCCFPWFINSFQFSSLCPSTKIRICCSETRVPRF